MKNTLIVLAILLFFISAVINVYIFRKEQIRRKEAQEVTDVLQAQNRDYKEQLEQYYLQEAAAGIRGLGFLKAVPFKEINRQEINKMITEKANEEIKVTDQRILRKFGFLKPGEDIISHIAALYGEQVQGMYDEEAKEMIMVKGTPLSGNLQRMFLVHELVHALQDQYYDLLSLPLGSDNYDRALASLALIEGDATMSMFQYYKDNMSIYRIFNDLLSYLAVDQSELAGSPYYLRETLLFPYKYGTRFVSAIYQKSGWPGVNAVYQKIPESSEQIMHLERYPEDKPVDVAIDETIPGWEMVNSGTAGEFNIKVLLAGYLGEYASLRPAEGWGGDKWQVWEDPETKKLKVIWYIVWDSKEDADEFYNTFRRFIGKRYPYMDRVRIIRSGDKMKIYW